MKNCHAGRERKFLDDELMLDTILPQEVAESADVTYQWKIYVYLYNTGTIRVIPVNMFMPITVTTSTGSYFIIT